MAAYNYLDITLGLLVDYIEKLHLSSKNKLKEFGLEFITALPDGYASVLSTIKKCYSVFDCDKKVREVVPDVLVDSKTVQDLVNWIDRRIGVVVNSVDRVVAENRKKELGYSDLGELLLTLYCLSNAVILLKRADACE